MTQAEPLTTGQVARRLGVSTTRVIQLAAAGHLPHTRTALGRLYANDGVERLARERNLARPSNDLADHDGTPA